MRLFVFSAEKMFTNNLLAKSRKVKYNRINLIIDAGRKFDFNAETIKGR